MLQQAPAVHHNQQEVEKIVRLFQDMHALGDALEETDPAEALQVLQAVLQQQAARSAGIVLVWASQRPEQLSSGAHMPDEPLLKLLTANAGILELNFCAAFSPKPKPWIAAAQQLAASSQPSQSSWSSQVKLKVGGMTAHKVTRMPSLVQRPSSSMTILHALRCCTSHVNFCCCLVICFECAQQHK
jgi:hypothetical protein